MDCNATSSGSKVINVKSIDECLPKQDEEFYLCKLCRKLFSSKIHWRVYISARKNETVHVCEQCNKNFEDCPSPVSRTESDDDISLSTSAASSKSQQRVSSETCDSSEQGAVVSPKGRKPIKKKVRKKNPPHSTVQAQESSIRKKQLRPRKFQDVKYADISDEEKESILETEPIFCVEVRPKRYNCPECGKKFSVHSNMKLHMRLHTGEKPCACNICPKRFANPSNLHQHRKTHTGEKPHGCEECGKTFAQKSQLKTHMKTHTREKPFTCKECGKRLGYAISLKLHMKTHTREKSSEEKVECEMLKPELDAFQASCLKYLAETKNEHPPFTCFRCHRVIMNRKSLKPHFRTHSGEKPYHCPQCSKRFSYAGNLIEHVRTHTGEKPYGCTECGKHFVQGSQLKTHMKVHGQGD